MTQESSLVEYIRKPETLTQFEQVLGKGANSYIQSVAIAVKENPALLECSYESIVNSALRSASLGLSCDPSVRQAYIIPRSKRVNGKYIKVAQFQPHYNGLYNLAQRTGKYRYISVNPIYKGETVYEDVSTGLHVYSPPQSKTLLMPDKGHDGLHTGYRDVTSGKNTEPVIGYVGYFKTNKGFEKSVWMTVEEIEQHAKNYSDSYSKDFSAWKDPKKKPTMQMKTVLIALLKWADLSGSESALLTQALDAENEIEEETVDAEVTDVNTNVVSSAKENEFVAEDAVDEIEVTPEELHEQIMKLAKELGGKTNEKLTSIVKSYGHGGNFKKITDIETLKKLKSEIEKLKENK